MIPKRWWRNCFLTLGLNKISAFWPQFLSLFLDDSTRWDEMPTYVHEIISVAVLKLASPKTTKSPGLTVSEHLLTCKPAGYFPNIKLRRLSSLFLLVSSLYCPYCLPLHNHLSLSVRQSSSENGQWSDSRTMSIFCCCPKSRILQWPPASWAGIHSSWCLTH